MPSLKIFTNLSKNQIPEGFVSRIFPVLAKCVNKPAEKFLVTISPDCILANNEHSTVPMVVASLESIGNLGLHENKVIAKDLSGFIEKELNIDQNLIFLTFYDLQAYNVAKDGVIVEKP